MVFLIHVLLDVNALSMLLTRVQSNIVQLNMTERMLRAELTSIDGNLTAIMNDPVCNMSGCGSLTLDISAFNDATSMVSMWMVCVCVCVCAKEGWGISEEKVMHVTIEEVVGI